MTKYLHCLFFIVVLLILSSGVSAQGRVNAMPSWEENQEEGFGWTGHSMIVWGTAFGGRAPYTAVIKVDDTILTVNDPYPVLNSSYYAFNHYWGRVYTPRKCGFHWVKIEVTDRVGVTRSDSSVIFVSNAPTDSMKVDMMIDKGNLFLFKNALIDGNYISYGSSGANVYSAMACAMIAFQERGHFETNDSMTDPYAVFVHKGMGYVLNKYSGQFKIDSLQTNCRGVCRVDRYTAGAGKDSGAFVIKNSGDDVYANAFGLLAVIMARRDSADAVNSIISSGRFSGWSYYNLVLNALDLIYWNQSDNGTHCGLWTYSINYADPGVGDGSIEQWPVLVFKAADDRWKIKTPWWIDSTTMVAYRYLTSNTGIYAGGCGYGASGSIPNIAKTAGKLMAYAWVGKYFSNNDPDAVSAVNFIQRYYFNLGNSSGGGGWAANLYDAYSMKKGMRFQKIDSLYVGFSWRNWYYDMIAWFSGNTIHAMDMSQFAFTGRRDSNNCYGQMQNGSWKESFYISGFPLATAHVILLLLPHLFEPHPLQNTSSEIVCAGDSTILSAAQGSCYHWFPPDGLSSITARNPVAKPTKSITYMVNIGDSTNCPCPNRYEIHRITLSSPLADFRLFDSFQCLSGNNFFLLNTSPGTIVSSLWNFGDHTTSSDKSPFHHFTNYGPFNIKLTVTSNLGCRDTLVKTVTVAPNPKADFVIDDSAQCISGNQFHFYDSTKTFWSESYNRSWNFGDTDTSNSPNPSHFYLATDTFTVRLIANSVLGCADTIVKKVIVATDLETIITADTTSGCLSGNQFVFRNTGKNAPAMVRNFWDFGDGKSSDSLIGRHSYGSSGIYRVTLYASSVFGCRDTAFVTINVLPDPKADFIIDSSFNCINSNKLIFTNNGSISSGTYTNHWDFGDSLSMDSFNAFHKYSFSGKYQVKLISTSQSGCSDTAIKSVWLKPVYPADFTIDSSKKCLTANHFIFTNTSSSLADVSGYQWNFGDGDSVVSKNASHSYSAAGSFRVKLILFYISGCLDSLVKTVHVYPMPQPAFSIDSTRYCLADNKINFSSTGSISSGTYSNFWDFGDGIYSATLNASHSYAASGIYQVKLKSASGFGCSDSISHPITIYNSPKAGFNIDSSNNCFAGNKIIFTDNSSIPAGIYTDFWSFGDGNFSTTLNTVHSYGSFGTYSVKLRAISPKGCKDSIIKTVIIHPEPLAAFTIDSSKHCLAGNDLIFTNTGTIPTGLFNNKWEFGDGGIAGSLNENHSYGQAGVYQVKMLSVSLYGCIDSVFETVRIYPDPDGSFSVNGNILARCEKQLFNFIPKVKTNWQYLWNFGDGNTSDSVSPWHGYMNAGVYDAWLNVITKAGCTDKQTHKLTVYPLSVADFDYILDCCNGHIKFTNKSIQAKDYLWYIGDKVYKDSIVPDFTFENSGLYKIELYTNKKQNCPDSISKTVDVILLKDHIFIPTAFTPDNNLLNDSFCIKGVDWHCCRYSLVVFDRWGEKLYDSNDHPGEAPYWDGSWNGVKVSPGVYYYHLIFQGGGRFGVITLLR